MNLNLSFTSTPLKGSASRLLNGDWSANADLESDELHVKWYHGISPSITPIRGTLPEAEGAKLK